MGSIFLINHNKQYLLVTITIVVCVFIGSLFLAPYYFGSDQHHYHLVYSNIKNIPFFDAFDAYKAKIVTQEFGHFIIIWVTSGLGIEKNLVMALANSYLAFLVMKICQKWGASVLVSSLICVTNYYMFALYFSAERLKFAVIFFLISIYHINNLKKIFVFSLLSLTFHLQFMVLYSSFLFPKYLGSFFRNTKIILLTNKIRKKSIIEMLAIIGIIISIWIIQGQHLLLKFNYHTIVADGDSHFTNMWRAILFYCMTIFYGKNFKIVTLNYIPLIIAIFFFGGHRLNIFAYMIFLYYALAYKRGLNFGILITTIYFALKSFNFVNLFVSTGSGY